MGQAESVSTCMESRSQHVCVRASRGVVSANVEGSGRCRVDRSLKHLDLPNAREQATPKQLLDGAEKGDLDLVKKAIAKLVKAGASLDDVQDKVGGHRWWWTRMISPTDSPRSRPSPFGPVPPPRYLLPHGDRPELL